MNQTATIRVRDLKKSFGDKVVLDGVNLDVWPGESLVVIGQSGVGKSVLIKCIIGILSPDSPQVKELAEEKLRMVGLPGILDLMPSELSGGMRKRVGLARAIAIDPEIMLYDEPTTGLDPIRGDSINDLIIQLREELGVASISITHDMVSAYKIADRITMLYKGKLIATGTPDEIRGSDNPYVQQFIHGKAEGPIRDE